jgi:hypothetical protein
MKKISKMTWIKIILSVLVIGVMVFFICKWNIKLDPPQKIPLETPEIIITQMYVKVVMPARIIDQQYDADAMHSDPEGYAMRFNNNNEVYNKTLRFSYQNGAQVGDTVQLKYTDYFNYQTTSDWKIISIEPPFYESTESSESHSSEYIKGVISGIE